MRVNKEQKLGRHLPDVRWLLLGLILATAVLLFLNLPQPWPQLAAFTLIALWSLLSWSHLLAGDWFERLLFAGAAALLLNMLWVLLVSYIPGEIPVWLWVMGPVVIAAGPLLKTAHTEHVEVAVVPSHDVAFSKREWGWLGLLFLLAISLRIVNLSYSEFQGDEGVIMVRAANILAGNKAALFLHQKGPVEILLPLGLWGLNSTINEFWARILFAWAGILSVGAVVAVARRWFGSAVAIWAGYLFAIVGFSIAFSRIVQYQSLVVLWGALALFCAIRYTKTEKGWDLVWSALFLAAGLLAHYDAVLVAPAVAWLLGAHVVKTRRFVWLHWVAAMGVGTAVLAAFYVPFMTNPNFGRTGQYLLGARLGVSESTGIFSWSGPAFWQMITLYNSTYFVIGLALLLLFGLWFSLRAYRNVTAVLYFAAPFLFYLLVVVDPRTHVYTIFPGAVILAALALVTIWQWLTAKSRPLSYVLAACFGVWFAVSALYVYLMFIDHSPERMRTWAENRPVGYWTTWQEPPLYGLFGFPHQAGWRSAADLVANTGLPYASNEEEEITNWYMKQSPRTYCPDLQTFILAADVQDAVPYDETRLVDFSVAHEVVGNGRSTLQIFTREKVEQMQTHSITNDSLWLSPTEAVPSTFGGENPVNVTLGDEQVHLLGYDADLNKAYPGGEVAITLYWQVLQPFDQNYQTFVHLYDGELVGQHDGMPSCNTKPTTGWIPGQIIVDTHIIPIASDAQPGQLDVLTGMYNLITLERLQVPDHPENLIVLPTIQLRESVE
ncbi:MAG: glycosyltransferase family 39 protein [Anaerolineae bacterium]|nr:glycosyltransferase family 39 protein [Anaerolineae bacterium]